MACDAPNFQLELMPHDEVMRESFQKIQSFFCDESKGLPKLILDIVNGVVKPGDIVLALGGVNSPAASTSNPSYTVLSEFEFGGSTSLGVPQTINVIAGSTHASNFAALKIFDQTNLKTIAENVEIVGVLRTITDMGTIANVPADAAIWEIQGKKIGGGTKAEVSSLRMIF